MTIKNNDLLTMTLQVSVPLWIERMKGRSWEYIQSRGKECAQYIAEHGDSILYRSTIPGQTACAFNRLAEGLSCLSFAPGGVDFMGMHWESKYES